MDKPFRYPETIQADRANAVRQLVFERPELATWQVMRDWVEELGIVKVLQDIALILEYNGLDGVAQAKLLDLWSLHLIIRNYPPCYDCEHWECVVEDEKGNPVSGYCWDVEADMNGKTGCSRHTRLNNGTDASTS